MEPGATVAGDWKPERYVLFLLYEKGVGGMVWGWVGWYGHGVM